MKVRFVVAVLVACLGAAYAQQLANSNDSIIKMVKAGLGDTVVIDTIKAQPAHFSLGVNDLIALKNAGVDDKVIAAMIAKENPSAAAPTPAAAAPASAYPTDIGVYYDKKGVYTQLQPEIVNTKSGGFLKSLATDGIVKGDINGHIKGPHSPNTVFTPAEFILVVRDGDVPQEYQLLRLRAKSKYREFRSITGGVFHSSTGASRDDIAFTTTKVASRTYKIVLPVGTAVGDYGFLPPGAFTSRNIASSGMMYTFQIVE